MFVFVICTRRTSFLAAEATSSVRCDVALNGWRETKTATELSPRRARGAEEARARQRHYTLFRAMNTNNCSGEQMLFDLHGLRRTSMIHVMKEHCTEGTDAILVSGHGRFCPVVLETGLSSGLLRTHETRPAAENSCLVKKSHLIEVTIQLTMKFPPSTSLRTNSH